MIEGQKDAESFYEFDTGNFVQSFMTVAKSVITKPTEFFDRMPRRGSLLPPAIYLGVCLGISGVLSALIHGGRPLLFFKLVVLGLVVSFLTAGILHVLALKLFQGKGEYEGTYRVVAYAGTVNLLGWIPVVNFLAAMYGFYLQITGLEKIHQITKGQVVVTILIAFLVYLVFFFLIFKT